MSKKCFIRDLFGLRPIFFCQTEPRPSFFLHSLAHSISLSGLSLAWAFYSRSGLSLMKDDKVWQKGGMSYPYAVNQTALHISPKFILCLCNLSIVAFPLISASLALLIALLHWHKIGIQLCSAEHDLWMHCVPFWLCKFHLIPTIDSLL